MGQSSALPYKLDPPTADSADAIFAQASNHSHDDADWLSQILDALAAQA